MFGQWIRRAADALRPRSPLEESQKFLIGRIDDRLATAEAHFKHLEQAARDIIHELETVSERLALRAAAEAKRKARAARRDLGDDDAAAGGASSRPVPVPPLDAKAELRRRIYGARGGQPPPRESVE